MENATFDELIARLRRLYKAFNSRDIALVLGQMARDVNWPNAWEGGRVYGHDGVRDYWTRQWAVIDSFVEPLRFENRTNGSVAVEVNQTIRLLDGVVLSDDRLVHVYVFHQGLITRMDVEAMGATQVRKHA